jgi:hypothetical protein
MEDAPTDVFSLQHGLVYVAIGVATYVTSHNLEKIVLSTSAFTLPKGRTHSETTHPGALPAADTSAYLRVDGAFLWDVALPMLAAGILFAANFSLVFVSAAVLALVLGGLNVASGGMAAAAAQYGSPAAMARRVASDLVPTSVGNVPTSRGKMVNMVQDQVSGLSGPLSQFVEMAYNSYRPWISFLSHLMFAYACTFMALSSLLYMLQRPRKYDTSTHFRVRGSTLYVRRPLVLTLARTLPWTALVLAICVTSGGGCASCVAALRERIIGPMGMLAKVAFDNRAHIPDIKGI